MLSKRVVLGTAVAVLLPMGAWAHPGHGTMWSALYERISGTTHPAEHATNSTSRQARVMLAAADAPVAPAKPAGELVSGQGELQFRVFATGSLLPGEAGPVLVKAHGGFAVDRRPGKGETYFALPGAGIIKLSADMKSSELIPTPDEVKNTNLHNALIWYGTDGTPFLAFPANDANKVFTLSLDGKLLNTLEPPAGKQFADAAVTTYFSKGENKFVPTDLEFLNSTYYITTGYSALDYVLEAKVTPADGAVSVAWAEQAFGGKGTGPGQFGTGHGITVSQDKSVIHVSDRANSEIDRFTPDGKYLNTLTMPAKSLPCDIAFESEYTVVGCLEGPDKSKGAPIYIVKDEKIVSTIMPKDELGLSQFTHVHNATIKAFNGRLYVIAQAWNPGDFAIFEQVK